MIIGADSAGRPNCQHPWEDEPGRDARVTERREAVQGLRASAVERNDLPWRAGHFGAHGMHERAKLIGGKLSVWSTRDSGSEIELSTPAARAYAQSLGSRGTCFDKELADKSVGTTHEQ
jgi:hypothetical protein